MARRTIAKANKKNAAPNMEFVAVPGTSLNKARALFIIAGAEVFALTPRILTFACVRCERLSVGGGQY